MTSNGTIASTDGEQQHLQDKKMEVKEVAAEKDEKLEKCYFDVLGLCCSSEVPLVEKILHSINGVKQVSVVVPSKTVIVVYDSLLVSPSQIAKALNQAKLEANVRVNGEVSHRKKWPSPYVILCGALLALSFLKYAYAPLGWLAVGAVAVGVWPIGMRAVAAVRNFTLDVNVLVLIAVIGTLALRDYLEAATIVFLFTVAEWLQSRASHKATAVMSSLMNIAPQKATVADTGEVVNVTDVKQNTILAVKAGESIPIDGVVAEGSCEVDEKALTGEAFPVHKQKDAIVWAGTINLNGYILVKTMALAEDCAVAKMAKLVEEAQNKRPKIQRLIDHCAKYYTPAVVLISAGLAAVPAALRVHDQKHWFHLALVVLVSACPCGLILSTPVATFCALSRAATSGLLIKGGDYIETLAKIKVVAFDKTGTITRGEFVMTGFQSLSEGTSMNELLYWVSSLESKSSHPIADAVVGYGRSQSIEPRPEIVQEFQIFPGEGVSGKIDGREIYVGNRKFGRRAGCVLALEIECGPEDGRTLGFVYSNGAVIGTFKLTDACRSGAADALKELKSMGITTALLTGDSKSAAMHAQNELGHALDAVHAELLPEEKARIVEDYKKSVGPTSMVGDGINDAPALATADVGISMGVSGTALATETGHVILMSNDVRKIPSAIKLAKRTRRKVIENLVFSISAKVIVLAVAFAGYPIIWLAVMADVLTCLLVILNSMLLLRQGHGHGGPSHHHSHGHHHHKGNCNGSSDLSNHNVHQHEKSGCCNGSSDLSHEHSHQHDKGKKCEGSLRLTHHHHAHDEKRSSHGMSNLHCHSHDVVNGSHHHGSSVSHHGHGHGHDVISYGNPSKSCEAAKCSSPQGCKGGGVGISTSKTCSNNITCDDNKNDSGLHNRPQLQSIPRTSCEKEDCKDLEGQNGCLGGDGCGLSNKTQFETFLLGGQTDRQAVCCGSHVEEKVSDSAIEDDITIEVCGPGRVESNTFENECHCTKEIRHEHSEPISNHACTYVDVVGNREIGGCCRSFRKECCQIHQHGHVHGSFAAGFGGGGLTEIVTE